MTSQEDLIALKEFRKLQQQPNYISKQDPIYSQISGYTFAFKTPFFQDINAALHLLYNTGVNFRWAQNSGVLFVYAENDEERTLIKLVLKEFKII